MESKSTFKITRWDEAGYDEAEPRSGRVHVDTARLEHELTTLDHDLG